MAQEPDGNAAPHPPGREANDGGQKYAAWPYVLITSAGVLLVLLILLLWPDRVHQVGDGHSQGLGSGGGQAGRDPFAQRQQHGEEANPGSAMGGPSPTPAGAEAGTGGASSQIAGTPAAPPAEPPAEGTPEAPPVAESVPTAPTAGPGPQSVAAPPTERGSDGKPLPPMPPLPPDVNLKSDSVKEDEKKPLPKPLPRSISKEYGARTERSDNSAAARGARRLGMTAGSEAAVNLGLKWLAQQQAPSGEWRDAHAVGVTGLALLAFLGAGHTHRATGPYQDTVQRGVDWLRHGVTDKTQASEGNDG